jgi:DNA-binding NtrC family response regulator
MSSSERRGDKPDRRLVPRGGRRADDQPGRFPHVLVAESYDGARIPCVKYLDRCGFYVHEAADGCEALAKIEAARPHVVLTESALPNAPLARIVETMRRCDLVGKIALLVMTSELEPAFKPLDAGPLITILSKPFSLSGMLQEIRRLLQQQPPVALSISSATQGLGAVLVPGTVAD